MAAIRWRVQFYGENAPGVYSFGVESFSRENLTHECEIDMLTGRVFCTCEHARFNLNDKYEYKDVPGGFLRVQVRVGPTIGEEELETRPCIHARRVVSEAGWICAERERTAKRINKELRRMAA